MAKKEKTKKQTAAQPEAAGAKKVKVPRSIRKKQQKELRKQQAALEKQLVAEGKIRPHPKYRSRNFFWRALALCVAFILGVFGAVGGIAALGVSLSIGTVTGAMGVDLNGIINSEYTSKSILGLIQSITEDIGNIDSIASISKITPVVDNVLDQFMTSFTDLGINIDTETLKEIKFEDIGAYMKDEVLNNIVLGDVMSVTPSSDAMLIGLCYGEEGVDYTVQGDTFVQVPGGRTPTKISDLMDGPTDLIGKMRLGTLMGLGTNVTESDLSENAMMYSLCYGKRGTDYELEDGKIVVLGVAAPAAEEPAAGGTSSQYVHTFPTTVDALMHHSNAVIDSLELGSMLGLDGSDIDSNGVMYSLAYGSRGIDWEYTDGKIVMLEGHDDSYPTKMGDFTNRSSELIDDMEIEALMNIKPDSDSLMHYLAYGTEMPKGKANEGDSPWREEGGKYYDAENKLVDKNGYLLDAETNFYLTDDEQTDPKQYKDGARFIYEYGQNGKVTGIQMLPDPNAEGFDPTHPWAGKLYSKKKVSDLTDSDADLVEGMKIGNIMEIDSDSSSIMQAMKDWTIDDLKDQSKIESLTIGDVLGKEGMTSNIMKALKNKTLEDMKKQETIDALKLSDVLDIHEEDAPDGSYTKSSGIMIAMRDWHLDDLSKQYRIDRLKIGNVITIDGDSSSIMQAMQDWRIGDLAKQDRIDSLTLGDVMVIDGDADGILAALKDCPIGSMQTRIDTLTLTEILGESEVTGNKLLKHLKDSTVKTLASDMESLSIGEVFADELFSFMEIKGDNTYQKLYKDYYDHHSEENHQSYLPQKYMVQGKAIVASEVETYYVLTSSLGGSVAEVVPHYYTKSGEQYTIVPDGTEVKADASIVMENRTSETQKTPYYFETEIKLTPVYEYKLVNYAQSKLDDLPEGDEVSEEDGTLYYKTGGAQYEIEDDGYSLYYLIPAAVEGEEDTRVDLDRQVSGYKIEAGDTMSLTEGKIEYNGLQYDVHHKKAVTDGDSDATPAYDYITVRTEVYERYAKQGDTATYEKKDTTERYRYTPAESEAVQLDRFLDGVWFMLLAQETGADDGVGTITYNVSTPILEMDGLITKINSSITAIPLWKLHFHGMLQEDPFVDLTKLPLSQDGVDLGGDRKVKNLNECTVTDTITLLQKIIGQSSIG